ncbi:MAG: hypothetical protein KJO12_08340 [Ignavibacteria bacterium]|nr:hypothetical protein [Ignavibacteria bacterium]
MSTFKRILAIFILTSSLFTSFNLWAQKPGSTTTVDSEGLFTVLYNDSPSNMRAGFCQDVSVTIDLQFVQIETTITICCSTDPYICLPIIEMRTLEQNGQAPNDLEIVHSASIDQGGYSLRVKKGHYDLNEQGEITNLKYHLTKK